MGRKTKQKSLRIAGVPVWLGLIVLLPVAIVGAIALGVAKLMGSAGGAVPSQPLSPEDRAREVALAALLRKLSIDSAFTRAEARTAGLVAESPATADELVDLALARGWVVQSGAHLSVSTKGRQQSDDILRRARL